MSKDKNNGGREGRREVRGGQGREKETRERERGRERERDRNRAREREREGERKRKRERERERSERKDHIRSRSLHQSGSSFSTTSRTPALPALASSQVSPR